MQPSGCSLTWVSELLTADQKHWNEVLINSLFNSKEAAHILNIPISRAGIQDKLVWQHTTNGAFSVASAYSFLASQRRQKFDAPECSKHQSRQKKMWSRLWEFNIKGKIKHFMWRVLHNIIPTKAELKRRKLQGDTICHLCGDHEETIEHLFFQCPSVRKIWQISPVQWEVVHKENFNFRHWWEQVCKSEPTDLNQARLELTTYLMWNIWKRRNKWLFKGEQTEEKNVVDMSQSEWMEFCELGSIKRTHPPKNSPHASQSQSHFPVQEVGYYNFSISAIAPRSSSIVACGSVNKDLQGAISLVKYSSATVAGKHQIERCALEATRDSLLLAHRSKFGKICIYLDNKAAVAILQSKSKASLDIATLAEDIFLLKSLFVDCKFLLVSSKDIGLSRKLAKKGLIDSSSTNWLSPSSVRL